MLREKKTFGRKGSEVEKVVSGSGLATLYGPVGTQPCGDSGARWWSPWGGGKCPPELLSSKVCVNTLYLSRISNQGPEEFSVFVFLLSYCPTTLPKPLTEWEMSIKFTSLSLSLDFCTSRLLSSYTHVVSRSYSQV